MKTARYPGALEGLSGAVFLTDCHEAGHFRFRNVDLFPAPICQMDISNFEISRISHNLVHDVLALLYLIPAADFSSSALSVFSQVNSGSSLPKWP